MKNQRFSKGDRVWHRDLKVSGTVECCINAKDVEDLKAQGPRYEVWFQNRGGLWSVTQSRLQKK